MEGGVFIDSSTVPSGQTLEAEVCIIGAGPVGITLALELRQEKARILVLESGGEEPEVGSPWLKGTRRGWWYEPLEDTRARGFGGTSVSWPFESRWSAHGGMSSLPLEQIDFESRSWVPNSGWPFDLDHLRPYYARAHTI